MTQFAEQVNKVIEDISVTQENILNTLISQNVSIKSLTEKIKSLEQEVAKLKNK